MEFEIGDDPQGLPDGPEGERDGGLRGPVSGGRHEGASNAPSEQKVSLDQPGEPA